MILLLDTSGCKFFDTLRRNYHGPLLGLCGSSVGMSAEKRLLIGAFFFQHALLDLCLKRAPLVLAENTGLSCFWVVEECAFRVKTCEDAFSLPDMFLGTLSCPRSISVAKCVNIALSDIEEDDTVVCILLYFWPTGSPECFRLSRQTDLVVPRRVSANTAGSSFFS